MTNVVSVETRCIYIKWYLVVINDKTYPLTSFSGLTASVTSRSPAEVTWRKLYKNSTDGFIFVQIFHDLDDLFCSRFDWDRDVSELDSDLLSSLRFHAHIYRRVGAFTGLNDG